MARKKTAEKNNEPLEWQQGQAQAREVRARVAEQLSGALVGRDMTGGQALVARRLRELQAARQGEDAVLLRAAAWEAALAMAAWVVQLDLDAERERAAA